MNQSQRETKEETKDTISNHRPDTLERHLEQWMREAESEPTECTWTEETTRGENKQTRIENHENQRSSSKIQKKQEERQQQEQQKQQAAENEKTNDDETTRSHMNIAQQKTEEKEKKEQTAMQIPIIQTR